MHTGNNVRRLRSYRGIQQGDMAKRLRMPADTYAQLEGEDVIADDVLKRIASELDYEPEFIKWLPEPGPSFYNHGPNYVNNQDGTVNAAFNPIEKITELYERLLKSEQEKVAFLQSQLAQRG